MASTDVHTDMTASLSPERQTGNLRHGVNLTLDLAVIKRLFRSLVRLTIRCVIAVAGVVVSVLVPCIGLEQTDAVRADLTSRDVFLVGRLSLVRVVRRVLTGLTLEQTISASIAARSVPVFPAFSKCLFSKGDLLLVRVLRHCCPPSASEKGHSAHAVSPINH